MHQQAGPPGQGLFRIIQIERDPRVIPSASHLAVFLAQRSFADRVKGKGGTWEVRCHVREEGLHLLRGKVVEDPRRIEDRALLWIIGDPVKPAVICQVAGKVPLICRRADVLLSAGDHIGKVQAVPEIAGVSHLVSKAGESCPELHHQRIRMALQVPSDLLGKVVLADRTGKAGALHAVEGRRGLCLSHLPQDPHRIRIREDLRELLHRQCPAPERDAKGPLHAVFSQPFLLHWVASSIFINVYL